MNVSVLWLFLTLPCVGLQYVIVVFPDHTHLLFDGKERACCFTLFVFLVSCGSYCSVVLPHGDVGCTAVCDCGIF